MLSRPILNSCCFCASLKTGAQIIGWMYVISGFGGLIAGLGLFIYSWMTDINENIFALDGDMHWMVLSIIFYTIIAIIIGTSGLLLLRGVKKTNPKDMVMIIIVMLIYIFLTSTNFLVVHDINDIVITAISLSFQIYLFLVVFSFYESLNNEKVKLINNDPFCITKQPDIPTFEYPQMKNKV